MAKIKPSLKDWTIPEQLVLIEGWARDGYTMEMIAEKIGITKGTLYGWTNKNEDFLNAIKNGKEVADYKVENALFKNAMDGNVTAQIYWLQNRLPKKWKTRNRADDNEEVDNKLELQVTVRDMTGDKK